MADTYINKYLVDDVGENLNRDYSATPDTAEYVVPAGEKHSITRMIIYILDSATHIVFPHAARYGNIDLSGGTGLVIKILDSDDSVLVDLTDGVPIKSNSQWAALCDDLTTIDFGTGPEAVVVRWTFAKAGRRPGAANQEGITLTAGQKIVVTLVDDLDGLVQHNIIVRGRKHPSLI